MPWSLSSDAFRRGRWPEGFFIDRVHAGMPELDALPTPYIVTVRLSPMLYHSIVVREVGPDGVRVMDPLNGLRVESWEPFLRRWTGGALWISNAP